LRVWEHDPSDSLASTRPWAQTTVLPKGEKTENRNDFRAKIITMNYSDVIRLAGAKTSLASLNLVCNLRWSSEELEVYVMISYCNYTVSYII
jgi:hypothetical protein